MTHFLKSALRRRFFSHEGADDLVAKRHLSIQVSKHDQRQPEKYKINSHQQAHDPYGILRPPRPDNKSQKDGYYPAEHQPSPTSHHVFDL